MSEAAYSVADLSIEFQSTSSEEDVVSNPAMLLLSQNYSFNPRPPKRTLCPAIVSALLAVWMFQSTSSEEDVVSEYFTSLVQCFRQFQSTSSEEDVVSPGITLYRIIGLVSIHVLRRGRCVLLPNNACAYDVMFQSTSSEEDVVS